ncbi:MAG: acylphosphatase [Bacteroidota bacterium]
MMKHLNIVVCGKVQGVFYRASAKRKAEEMGVSGFARNEPSGNVYIEAEAPEEVLHEFVKWCSSGPPRAQVDDVTIKSGEVQGFIRFEVMR